MKQFISILVILGVLLQTSGKALVIANYYLNKDYISKNLCENRDKPQMKCCGKCYLKKQLNKDENNSKQLPGKSMSDEVVFFQSRPEYLIKSPTLFYIKDYNLTANDTYEYRLQRSVFHPPSNGQA